MAFDPADFTVEEPKSIPVVLLLDVSSSMSGNEIIILNKAVEAMINSFKKAETMETFIKLSIITFGSKNGVDLHTPLTEVSKIDFQPLNVSGSTPMGAAFRMGKEEMIHLIKDIGSHPAKRNTNYDILEQYA